MAYEVVWSPAAVSDLEEIVKYLQTEWSNNIVIKFINDFNIFKSIIAINPHIGKASTLNRSIRRVLISKHNALYYQVTTKQVILLNIFDTRQNPHKNPFS